MKTQKQLHARYIGLFLLLLIIYSVSKCSQPEIHFVDVSEKIELKIYRKDGGMTTAHLEQIKIFYEGELILDHKIENDFVEGIQLKKNNRIVLKNYMEQEIMVINIDSLLKNR